MASETRRLRGTAFLSFQAVQNRRKPWRGIRMEGKDEPSAWRALVRPLEGRAGGPVATRSGFLPRLKKNSRLAHASRKRLAWRLSIFSLHCE